MRLRPILFSLAAVPVLLAIAVHCAGADAIHFKNGTVLNNVRIIRDDWRHVDVQISDTVRLSFQRQGIEKIERERHHAEPLALRREYAGARVPAGLSQKLTQSIAVNYPEPTDFTEILNNIAELYGMTINVDQKVKAKITTGALDPMWTFKKEDGRNVSDMLEKLVRDKDLTFGFQDGSILITIPEQPAARNVQQGPQGLGAATPATRPLPVAPPPGAPRRPEG
jgi:hypothetical protein